MFPSNTYIHGDYSFLTSFNDLQYRAKLNNDLQYKTKFEHLSDCQASSDYYSKVKHRV